MNDWGHVNRELAMGIEPHNKQDRLGTLLLRRRNDETLAALLPLLEEVAALPDDELLRQEIHNILNLRKENAKLRGLRLSYRTSSETFLRESGRMRSRTHTARRCVDRPVWPTIHDARGRNVGRAAAALILITPF